HRLRSLHPAGGLVGERLIRRAMRSIAVLITRLNSTINRNLFAMQMIDPGRRRAGEPIRHGRHRVEDPEGVLRRAAEPVTEAWGGRSPKFLNFESTTIERAARDFDRFYTYSRGTPQTTTLRDVIYHNKYKCIFSTDGLRVDESCLLHYRPARFEAPEQIAPIEGLRTYDRSLIYVGGLSRHFGHFLTEGIARYWYAVADESRPILSHPFWRYSPMPVYIDR